MRLQLLYLFIHYIKPQRWYQGQYHTAGITRRQLWCIFMMLQHLVFSAGQVMMVAVAAKFKQHQSAQDMVAVPAMLRHGTFVISISPLLALQAVMLNIVHRFKQ